MDISKSLVEDEAINVLCMGNSLKETIYDSRHVGEAYISGCRTSINQDFLEINQNVISKVEIDVVENGTENSIDMERNAITNGPTWAATANGHEEALSAGEFTVPNKDVDPSIRRAREDLLCMGFQNNELGQQRYCMGESDVNILGEHIMEGIIGMDSWAVSVDSYNKQENLGLKVEVSISNNEPRETIKGKSAWEAMVDAQNNNRMVNADSTDCLEMTGTLEESRSFFLELTTKCREDKRVYRNEAKQLGLVSVLSIVSII
ncbi:hypothetical protein V6N11_084021 [Hibiscus sabdariffa]|uniref:Uncharacterized protein n=1 Tax=Hibiscus sabdariffa TaxID=183260 RepID=A0ABR2QDF0_9ROSI